MKGKAVSFSGEYAHYFKLEIYDKDGIFLGYRENKEVIEKELVAKQEEVVVKLREKYDENVRKLKDMYAKRDEEKNKAMLDAVKKSKRSYEEIMSFLTSNEKE